MLLSFRMMLLGIGVIGITLGVAFGAGVAYGKGDSKPGTVSLTQQQIQSIVGGGTGGTGTRGAGATGAGGTGATGTGTPTTGMGATGGTGAFGGGAAAILGSNTAGRVTAIGPGSITMQVGTNSVNVTLETSAMVQSLNVGGLSDIKAGDIVIVAGSRGADGTIRATAVSEVPAELQGLAAGTAGAQMGQRSQSGTPTP